MAELTISNIKKIEKLSVDFPEAASMVAFMGGNGTGKSTVIQIINTLLGISDNFPEALKRGEKEGEAIMEMKDQDGNPIKVSWKVTDKSSSFTAFSYQNGQASIIKDVGKIRRLIGNHVKLSSQEVLGMMKYAEGRRKFINDFLIKCLDEDLQRQLYEIDIAISDKKNKNTENNLFHKRTEMTKNLEYLRMQLNTMESVRYRALSEENIIEASESREDIVSQIKDLEDKIKIYKDLNIPAFGSMEEDLKTMISVIERLPKQEDLPDISSEYQKTVEDIAFNLSKAFDAVQDYRKIMRDYWEIQQGFVERRQRGLDILSDIDDYQNHKNKKESLQEDIKNWEEDIEKLSSKIQSLKDKKIDIIASSNLPKGLSFDDEGNITLNDFVFDENSVSETEAKLAILELLDAITDTQFIDIGDWSLYDEKSRKRILDIAKRKNRIIIGQMVTSDDHVTVKILE